MQNDVYFNIYNHYSRTTFLHYHCTAYNNRVGGGGIKNSLSCLTKDIHRLADQFIFKMTAKWVQTSFGISAATFGCHSNWLIRCDYKLDW